MKFIRYEYGKYYVGYRFQVIEENLTLNWKAWYVVKTELLPHIKLAIFKESKYMLYLPIVVLFIIWDNIGLSHQSLPVFIHHCTKNKVSIKGFFSKCDQTCSFMRIWSYLLKTYLMENFIFCTVHVTELNTEGKWQDCRRAFSVISRMQGSFCFFRLVE